MSKTPKSKSKAANAKVSTPNARIKTSKKAAARKPKAKLTGAPTISLRMAPKPGGPGQISGDEIYYKTEYVITNQYAPNQPHVFAPNTALNVFWHNLTLQDLWARFQKEKSRINNVDVPYNSSPKNPGIVDVTNFGMLYACVLAAYQKAGWNVNIPHFGDVS